LTQFHLISKNTTEFQQLELHQFKSAGDLASHNLKIITDSLLLIMCSLSPWGQDQ